jgi:hypothetical protein
METRRSVFISLLLSHSLHSLMQFKHFKALFMKPQPRNPLVFIGTVIASFMLLLGSLSLNFNLFDSKAASETENRIAAAPIVVDQKGLTPAAQLASLRAAMIWAELFAPTLGNYLNLLPVSAAGVATVANSMPVANTPPVISSMVVMRTAGAASANSTIANVSDVDQAANTLSVTVNGAASATLNGVTVSGLSISAAGVVTANVVATASAISGDFPLRVTDNAGATATATLVVIISSPACGTGSWNQQAYNFASDGAEDDNLGYTVAISGDTAIVGAYHDDTTGGTDAGSAYVFIRSGTVWTQQQKITASDGAANDQFGVSVAISGNTVIVGANLDDTAGGTDAGSAYVFTRSGTVWTQQQKLTASDGAMGDNFGISVALVGDTAIVGAGLDSTSGGAFAGSAYVFTRSGAVWTQQQQLTASDGFTANFFGQAVALSGDTVIVGANGDDRPGTNVGSAYIYMRSGGVWTEQQKIIPTNGALNGRFGISVAISGDSAIVGTNLSNRAYVFTRNGGIWAQQQELSANVSFYGISVAINGDTAIVGASRESTGGSAYIYTRSGGVWTERQKLTVSNGDFFGYSVALSGNTAILGDYFGDPAGGANAGDSYIFTLNCSNLTPTINAQSGVSRQQGSPGSNSTIATINDAETAPGSLSVTVTSANPSNGVTISNLVNSGGNITADIVAGCTATNASFTLQVSDGTSTATATLNVTVTANTSPILSYAMATVNQGSAATNSLTAATDNGQITGYNVQSPGTYTGTISVNSAGLVSISNAAPVGNHTITIRATDNCGAITDSSFTLTVNALPTISSGIVMRTVGAGSSNSTIANVSDVDQAANTLSVTVNGAASATSNGVTVSGLSINAGGVVTANVVAATGAVGADFTLRVTDSAGATATATLVVIVSWPACSVGSVPVSNQQAHNFASDGATNENFGYAVAISGDTAIVGAYGDATVAGTNSGSAYIFTRSGTVWTEQQKLTASDGAAFDSFGWSVAISGDTVIVGAYRDTTAAGTFAGSAYIFTRSGTIWTQQQKLTASDGVAFDQLGYSVAISGDTVIVGAYADDTAAGTDAGSAYVFTRSGTIWTEQQKLTASDGAASDSFGYSVAISGDTVIIGAFRDDTAAGTDAGSAYIFTRSGTAWTQQQKLTASDGATDDSFGVSVAISGDTAIVGAPLDDTAAGSNAGSAYVFTRSGGVWTEQQKLTASDGAANDSFGFAVAITGDTAIVGANADDTAAGANAGSAYVFTRSAGVWTQQQKLIASDGAANDRFGWSVAISGGTIIAGAYFDSTAAGSGAGSTYIFTRVCNLTPTINVQTGISRTQASPATNSTIAMVNDAETAPGSLSVTITSANPANGVTISNIVNLNGNITADIAAGCTATNASFTLQVNDGTSSATATLMATVTSDLQPPSLTCPTNISVNTAAGQCQATVTYTTPTASDNCPGATVSCTPASGGMFPKGVTTVTCTATDTAMVPNTTTCSFTVTVIDNQAPTFPSGCPANQTVNTANNQCQATVTYSNPTVSDNCTGATVSCSPASGTAFPKGVTTVTCTATDAATIPNTTTCSFTVTVIDNQPPSLTCPANISVNTAAGVCTAVATYTTPTANDNCPGATVSCTPASGGTFSKGVTTVTCIATDTATIPNTATCTFTITVVDNQAPSFPSGCPANQTVNTATGQCQATVTYSNPTVSDNCPGATVSCTPASGGTFPKGVTTVTCTATDTATVPNTTTCSFTVTVVDNQPPTFPKGCPANQSVITGNNCATVTYSNPTVSDNCPGATVTCSPASGTCFPAGTTTVTCTATDTATIPNTATCSFTITVIPCTITCPPNLTVPNNPNQCGAVVTFAPTALSGCGTVSCSPPSGSFFPKGTTSVTCNTTAGPSCSFSVTVNDTQPPSLTCPLNQTAMTPLTGGTSVVVSYPAPAVSDNCSGVIAVCTPPSGSTFSLGVTTVSCTATDASNNTTTCSFTVTVYNACLQDDSSPTTVIIFNTVTGDYRFCYNGSVLTGKSTVVKTGNTWTLTHNAADRKVLARVDSNTNSGTASLQNPVGTLKCSITDRNITNNSCQCQ